MFSVSMDLTKSWVRSRGTDVSAQVAADRIALDVARKRGGIELARGADANVHVLELAAQGAGGEHEAQVLVGLLGPAVVVVGERADVVGGLQHVHLAAAQQVFVEVGGVVGAGHHDAAHVLLQRQPEDVVGHADVVHLAVEVLADVLGAADKGQVDDGITAGEERAQRLAVVEQALDLDAGDLGAAAAGGGDVDEGAVVAFAQGGQHLGRHVAGGAGDENLGTGHGVHLEAGAAS